MPIESPDRLTTAPGSLFGIADTGQIEGALQRVQTIAERDALEPKILLVNRTLCFVVDVNTLFVYIGGENVWSTAPEDIAASIEAAQRLLAPPSLPGDDLVLVRDLSGASVVVVRSNGTVSAPIPVSTIIDPVPQYPGDDLVLVRGPNGENFLSIDWRGFVNGRVPSDQVVPVRGYWPGDAIVLAQTIDGTVIAQILPSGLLDAKLSTDNIVSGRVKLFPGDSLPLVENTFDGETSRTLVVNYDGSISGNITEESILPSSPVNQWPGDHLPLVKEVGTKRDVAWVEWKTGRLRFTGVIGDIEGLQAALDSKTSVSTVNTQQPDTDAPVSQPIVIGTDALLYRSTQWRGTWYGFEQRGTAPIITRAEAYDAPSVVVAFGGGSLGVDRAVTEGYEWHVSDEALDRVGSTINGAAGHAVAYLALLESLNKALRLTATGGQFIASTLEADALNGSSYRTALTASVTAAKAAFTAFGGKTAQTEAVMLSLLGGAQSTLELTADNHYAATASNIRADVATSQIFAPWFVVNQSFGTITNGVSPVALAEGKLDVRHSQLGFIVASPTYWCRVISGTVASIDPEDAILLDELGARARWAKENAGFWHCPRIFNATISGAVITADFVSLSNLVLDDPVNHGFAVDGITNAAAIQSVAVSGTTVTITLDQAPTGSPLTLRYAYGESGDAGDGRPINRGSLRDSWSADSLLRPGTTLYRRALSFAQTIN